MNSYANKKVFSCKKCGKEIRGLKENPHFPFCSKRCRYMDLGSWLSEEYTMEKQEYYDTGEEL
ncbi:DNA gyrase inhibitor YacG [Sedimentisphaera salicampi]|uniref:DNA gyrase inhibitor YacG n=1 Tax=Sedimentisphaera salicampi TaxID=1941349 RepID=A0A1W6LPS7_9BACT|nr:DNA gyrase inhibitor YacG [Sedimentisphaera salicampi]ARN57732.1 DNA gyrase inhibitor YacG [Sedimentisphaera salicampi]OXU14290.1 DNA gyrase inhibitor YacG [Sedimentisphaera salicampi]